MKKLFVLFLLLCAVIFTKGQTQPYGIIDTADLKLTSCNFEKDANAMVLYDKTEIKTESDRTFITRHKRIKIFNTKGMDAADITIAYFSHDHLEKIKNIEAQTINLENGKLKFTSVDNEQIYKQAADKDVKTITLKFPDLKPGSVIEYTYRRDIDAPGNMPDWEFQENLPVRYSEFEAKIDLGFEYKILPRVDGGFEKQIKEAIRGAAQDSSGTHYLWAVKNVRSFTDEPYTTCREDNIQNIRFFINRIPFPGYRSRLSSSWASLAGLRLTNTEVRENLNKHLSDDLKILDEAKKLTNDKDKISLIFGKIRDAMKWDGDMEYYASDDLKKVWAKKTGNCADINFILYNFLRMAGVKADPVYISTRGHGKVDFDLPFMANFNALAFVAKAGDKEYLLDASGKYNSYQTIPFKFLNCYAFFLDFDKETYQLKAIKDNVPEQKIILINANITPDSKLEGSAGILSNGNSRSERLGLYTELGEEKYKKGFSDEDNNLKILSLMRENTETDSLPLSENIKFKLDLTGSDDNYIYVNPTLLTQFTHNPFISEKRYSDIDFGNLYSYTIRSLYKMPEGYKIESLPENVFMNMPDTSISFKRIVAQENGQILITYRIIYNKALFGPDIYSFIHSFYKKMFEMLNEQIVLKKA